MLNEDGKEVTRRECDGSHVDAECEIRGCKDAEHGCIIQELARTQTYTVHLASVCA